jgi:hypothetical protein
MVLIFIGVSLAASPSLAGQASAIVEEVQASSSGVSQFDYVSPGQVVDLGSEGSMTLGYLASCQRERIQGGIVTIGKEQSSVRGGVVKRLKIACDGGSFQLTADQSQQSLAVVFRAYDPNKDKGFPKPKATLYGVSPVVSLLQAGGTLDIRRIDRAEQPISVSLDRPTMDLAPLNITLTPGGLYQANSQGRGITFKVDDSAGSGGPILSRLLRF